MSEAWKMRVEASKDVARAALLAHEEAFDWPDDWVLVGMEVADHLPNDWFVEVFMPGAPTASDRKRFSALFDGKAPRVRACKIEEQDWLTLSQQGVEPIRAGRFHVHTPEFAPSDEAGVRSLEIPASQAFGTGQHQTTAGCLRMLTVMKRQGINARNVADIGTGTGLLAFAALDLWPRALATASDIDAVCVDVVAHNAQANGFALGHRAGEVAMVVADGMDHQLLKARGTYDLLIANILAGPLVELAPDFARAVAPGGSLLLAGLLETQEARVRRAYRKAGFRLAQRLVNGDWSILWLRKRRGA